MMATLDWYGCATFPDIGPRSSCSSTCTSTESRAHQGIGLSCRRAPTAADGIVVGHSHFDHLWGAERSADKNTGVWVIGSL